MSANSNNRFERAIRSNAPKGASIKISSSERSFEATVYLNGRLIASIKRVIGDTVYCHDSFDTVARGMESAIRATTLAVARSLGKHLSIEADTPSDVIKYARLGATVPKSFVGRASSDIVATDLVRHDGIRPSTGGEVVLNIDDPEALALHSGHPYSASSIATDASVAVAAIVSEHGNAAAAAVQSIISDRNNKIIAMVGGLPGGAGHSMIRQRIAPINRDAWAAISRAVSAARGDADVTTSDVIVSRVGNRIIGGAIELGKIGEGTLMGLPIERVVSDGADADTNRLVSEISQAVQAGLPLRRPTQGMTVAARQGATIARTAVQTLAASRVSQLSSALGVMEEVYTATLDGRTSITCASLDGKRYPIGSGPMPPIHYNCRSVRLPAINLSIAERPYSELSENVAVQRYAALNGLDAKRYNALPYGHKTKFRDWLKGYRESVTGTVPADVSFSEWLSRQPRDTVLSVLGKTRGDAYMSGDLSISDMKDALSGRVYKISELKERGLL